MTSGRSRTNPAHGDRGADRAASCSLARCAKRAPAPAIQASNSAIDAVTEMGRRFGSETHRGYQIKREAWTGQRPGVAGGNRLRSRAAADHA